MPVAFGEVTIGGPFWGPRLAVLRGATLDANLHQCNATGRLQNFDRAAAVLRGDAQPGEYQGLLFNDSDVYKVLEGKSYVVGTERDAERKRALDAALDSLIARVAAAQCADGYINTYYTLKAGLPHRLTREEHDHETYCMGHLIEAGVAHAQATGKRTLLDVAIRAADYLRGVYGPDKFTTPPGHQELELALIKLAHATGNQAYAQFAHELVEYRGRPHRKLNGEMYGPWGDYAQDHLPAAEQHEAAGHAVRAAYLYAAMADLAARGHAEYRPALDSLWRDITERRIFVTGGIGPSGHNEGFTVPWDIPIQGAYQETCASIGLCIWAHRMFLLEGHAKYMEQFERTLYNAALAGVSLDGREFFYVNPMVSRGGHERQPWFPCACCPPNVLRFFGSLGQYIYAVQGDTLFVNLFMDSATTAMVHGQPVEVVQRTDYPFGGRVALAVRNHSDRDIQVAIRGNAGMTTGPDGYGRMKVSARSERTAEWEISMPPTRVYSDPRVKASVGHTAITRGPLVYAAEAADNGGSVSDFVLPRAASIAQEVDADGVPVLVVNALRASSRVKGVPFVPAKLTLRPYFMWANRGPGGMQVWFPETGAYLPPQPEPGVTATASFVGHGDGLSALTDRIVPSSSADGTIPRFTFWPHKGAGKGAAAADPAAPGAADAVAPGTAGTGAETEWVQCVFDAPRAVGMVGVYWFDDTGHGECRVPASCSAEYLSGSEWRPLPTDRDGAVPVAKDAMNSVRFDSVVADGLRLRIRMQPGMSAGILEIAFAP
ncbi:MAG: glycoside hydrolase family 127 protein [Phycisphaerae bacterium]|nr:glycoside hydrolase family 127 protein [Phycisphaerae bacterium]